VAEDPDAPPEDRVVAAYAGCAAGPKEIRERVLVAAERTADPSVGKALRKAANGKLSARDVARSKKLRDG